MLAFRDKEARVAAIVAGVLAVGARATDNAPTYRYVNVKQPQTSACLSFELVFRPWTARQLGWEWTTTNDHFSAQISEMELRYGHSPDAPIAVELCGWLTRKPCKAKTERFVNLPYKLAKRLTPTTKTYPVTLGQNQESRRFAAGSIHP